jgi:predicted GH43/DUF377 family glycosyl hydrolase
MSSLTMHNHHSDLFQRYKLNPILAAANWPYQVNSVFKPGATLLADGTTLLLSREESYGRHGDVDKIVFPCGYSRYLSHASMVAITRLSMIRSYSLASPDKI